LQSAWESAVSQETVFEVNHNIVLAGIIHHGAEISTSSLNFLVRISCVNKIRAHILGADDMSMLSSMYDRQKEIMFPGMQCAPFKVAEQPDYVTSADNRIDRIQAARDFQRMDLAEHFDFADLDKATIILADMDVSELPPLDQVVGNADKMNSRTGIEVDVLCSAGKMLHPYGYYDTFATILLPDTFVYPVNGRPVMTARPEEDASLIIGRNFSAEALMEWFHKEGGVDASPVPVRSCFGGLAIYRASKWLDQRCSYKDQFPEVNAKYANKFDDAPCEHVVMHNCLHAVDPTVVVAVQPDMHTIWHTSAGPQYALANHLDLAERFILDHLDLVRASRRLQANYTSPYYNMSEVNMTYMPLFKGINWGYNSSTSNSTSNSTNSSWFPVIFNETDSTNTTNATRQLEILLETVYDSTFFQVNCSNSTNSTSNSTIFSNSNSTIFSNFTVGSNCTEITHERRMNKIHDLLHFLRHGTPCSNTTGTNCTSSSTLHDFIKWVYDNEDQLRPRPGKHHQHHNSTNSTIHDRVADRDLELDTFAEQKIELSVNGEAEDMPNKPKLDFFIAGFPKCGTTSLLYAFKDNTETSVGEYEQCSIGDSNLSDGEAFDSLDAELSQLSQDPSVKRGIKCPVGISNAHALERLDLHSPEAKLLIGMRHPVEFFQSYYNYRITEIYDHSLPVDTIPPVESLVGSSEWMGVSTDSARFELYLMQLAKTEMSLAEFEEMAGRPHLAVKPNKFKVFLYTLSQMQDETVERKTSFREEMRGFLGLEKPLVEMEQQNKNHFVGEFAYKETIDICDARHDNLRALLVKQGEETQRWIRDHFILSHDVVVANKDHFLTMLDTWGHDPCRQGVQIDSTHSAGGVWLYIKSFMAPFFDMVGSLFS
jgi:hypothetical protein